MERPDFPAAVDSTIRGTFVSCPRKAELSYFHHWKPHSDNVHLHAGGAFASGLEKARRSFFEVGDSAPEAISKGAKEVMRFYGDFECPDDSAKSMVNMVGAIGEYVHEHGFATDAIQPFRLPDGKPAIEISFALPIEVKHPQTGDPILYTGRYDMLGEFQDQLWVVDEKTTTQLGKTWFNQWVLRGQLTGYCWAALDYGYPVVGAIIRGLAIRKRDYGHAQAISVRPKWQIDRWYKQLCFDVERMIQCWERGYFDYALDHACTEFGGCLFLDVCSSPNPERWLENDFSRRIWNPLDRTEIEVKQL